MASEYKDCEGYDPDAGYELVFEGSWSDYEESGWIAIFEKSGNYYVESGGYCVISDDNQDRWQPQQFTVDEVIEIMLDWEKFEEFDCTKPTGHYVGTSEPFVLS